MNPINKFKIKKFVVGYIQTNMYLIINDKKGVIIDPGFVDAEADVLIKEIKSECLKIPAVLLTHGHHDHISGLGIIKKKFNSIIYCHKLEREKLKDGKKNGYMMTAKFLGLNTKFNTEKIPDPDEYLNGGEEIKLIGLTFKIIHTPGHTCGGISILLGNVLFSGDTILKSSIGKADLYDSSYDDEISSIKNKILTLPPDTIIYPGHGPETTVKDEKKYFNI